MNDPRMNNILKWGIQNSEASRNDAAASDQPKAQLDPEALQALLTGMAGPSDAELMKESMDVIDNAEATPEAKYTAFENFEMLIEGIDNANNIEALGLWTRLLKHLESEDQKIRYFAAWCCGVAVQNNIRAQERLLVLDAAPTLVRIATGDDDQSTRKKAIYALSSFVRNFQPGLDATISHMPADMKPGGKLDANDMESVDRLIGPLRENA